MSKDEVITAALGLDIEDRAALARELLLSLETPTEEEPTPEENERLWLGVAERRLEELRSGAVKGVPGEEVMRAVEARLRARGDGPDLKADARGGR